jgi:hypothetical protein
MFLTRRASRRTPNWPKGNRLKDIHCRNRGIGSFVPLKLVANADDVHRAAGADEVLE